MIQGHGDDLYRYGEVRTNFSSNIFCHFDHSRLMEHLAKTLPLIESYPEPEPYSLERHLAERLGVDSGNVMATNGATEAIYLVAQTYAEALSFIVQPTFAEYADACRLHRHTVSGIKSISELEENLSSNAHVGNNKKTLLWLCNPNNPTGAVTDKQTIINIAREHPDILFVLDESYAAYTGREVIMPHEAVALGNVVLLSSMTKDYGIPGLRLGYAVAAEKLISRFRSSRMPWSVNAIAIEAGKYLIAHAGEYKINVSALCSERTRMAEALNELGIRTWRSDTNILLAELPHETAAALKRYLIEEHGILIRDASNFDSLSPRHFRIAMQLPEENDTLIKAIKEWITL